MLKRRQKKKKRAVEHTLSIQCGRVVYSPKLVFFGSQPENSSFHSSHLSVLVSSASAYKTYSSVLV